jgi:predicted adenylyl cyclase CyaB
MRNVEIKARLQDRSAVEARLAALPVHFEATLHQRDVFFDVPHGRLKLRFVNGAAELIQYERADRAVLRPSDYRLLPVQDGETLLQILQGALGTCGEVHKVRQLYRMDNVRIHLDRVRDLGEFLELEAVVDAQHDEASCRQAADRLLAALAIPSSCFESRAYVDLLRSRQRTP